MKQAPHSIKPPRISELPTNRHLDRLYGWALDDALDALSGCVTRVDRTARHLLPAYDWWDR